MLSTLWRAIVSATDKSNVAKRRTAWEQLKHRGWKRYWSSRALTHAVARRRMRSWLDKLGFEPRIAVDISRRRITQFRDVRTLRYWIQKLPPSTRARLRRNLERARLYRFH